MTSDAQGPLGGRTGWNWWSSRRWSEPSPGSGRTIGRCGGAFPARDRDPGHPWAVVRYTRTGVFVLTRLALVKVAGATSPSTSELFPRPTTTGSGATHCGRFRDASSPASPRSASVARRVWSPSRQWWAAPSGSRSAGSSGTGCRTLDAGGASSGAGVWRFGRYRHGVLLTYPGGGLWHRDAVPAPTGRSPTAAFDDRRVGVRVTASLIKSSRSLMTYVPTTFRRGRWPAHWGRAAVRRWRPLLRRHHGPHPALEGRPRPWLRAAGAGVALMLLAMAGWFVTGQPISAGPGMWLPTGRYRQVDRDRRCGSWWPRWRSDG